MLIMSCPDDAAGPRGEGEGWREDGDLNLWRPLTIDPIMISSERRTPPPPSLRALLYRRLGKKGFCAFLVTFLFALSTTLMLQSR